MVTVDVAADQIESVLLAELDAANVWADEAVRKWFASTSRVHLMATLTQLENDIRERAVTEAAEAFLTGNQAGLNPSQLASRICALKPSRKALV